MRDVGAVDRFSLAGGSAGVSPKAAQTLARHSDINLTMNVYTLLTVHDQASAVEALPPVPGQQT